jgi:hypothetical protein
MSAALVLTLWLAGTAPPPQSVLSDPWWDNIHERFRQGALQIVRMEQDFQRQNVEMLSRFVTQGYFRRDPKWAERVRKDIERSRARIAELQKQERDLWEQQPGGITAPPPRVARERP